MPALQPETLQNVVDETDHRLWSRYAAAWNRRFDVPGPDRLIFPTYSDGVVRVSEQEAKYSMVGRLADTDFLYSVETPTLKNYSFTGKGERSAATDLTLYDPDGVRLLNVEFKAHGISIGRKDLKAITKDIVKLVREDVTGLWFHTLERVDSGTIGNVWSVLRQEIKAVLGRAGIDFMRKSVFLHICVLGRQVSLQTEIKLPPEVIGPGWLEDIEPPVALIDDLAVRRALVPRRSAASGAGRAGSPSRPLIRSATSSAWSWCGPTTWSRLRRWRRLAATNVVIWHHSSINCITASRACWN